jgi:hypothetical protein
MIKKQVLEKIGNSKDCMDIAMLVIQSGFKATESSVRKLVDRSSNTLLTPIYMNAISKVSGVAIDELLETETAVA